MSAPRWHHIRVSGVVQGVGFRPTVFRLADRAGLRGTVSNDRSGVDIMLFATAEAVADFISQLRRHAPAISRIDAIDAAPAEPPVPEPERFEIRASSRGDAAAGATDVSPDAAICTECLADMRAPGRRHAYPLTNCTLCGPRFTITRHLPYDRPVTTMASFAMCDGCRREYTSPADRRFHAQPVSCLHCGPVYELDGETRPEAVVAELARRLRRGETVMVKSLGGYNLLADATNGDALNALRRLKNRPRKPFAVMTPRPASVASPAPAELELLTSWRAPIVICRRRADSPLHPLAAPGLDTVGVMLPYTGIHHMLFDLLGDMPLAVTSANFPGCPIIADDDEARRYAAVHGLALATNNRPIHNRCDDSVVRVVAGRPRLLRRSRGYVPDPVVTPAPLDGIMALGADISGQWALGRGRDAILSQYVGPLTSLGGEEFLRESVDRLSALYGFTPRVVAVDAHRGYASSALGREIARRTGARLVEVWHHHAHAAAVMAEHSLQGPALALVLDGTGAGPDSTVWGSELLMVTPERFERIAHGPYLPMPGGDAAAREPWRMAVSLCHSLGVDMDIPGVDPADAAIIRRMIDRGINCPPSCGAGRLWDAMAAVLGLARHNSYEAEAPILLEGAASKVADSGPAARCYTLRELLALCASATRSTKCRHQGCRAVPKVQPPHRDDAAVWADAPGVRPYMSADSSPWADTPEVRPYIARRFHELYARFWVDKICGAARSRALRTVVMAGGVMQNALLAEMIADGLRAAGLTPLLPELTPPGDGGLAVGQLYIAASSLEN